MSTLSAIKDSVIEIRDFIRREMTPEFMASIKSAIKSINETINDPDVQDDIKGSLRQLKQLLERANNSNVFENISTVLVDVDTILKAIDPDSIKNIISAINNMCSGQQALKEVFQKLTSVHCLRDLKDIGNMLIYPSGALALGIYAPIAGAVITTAVKYALDKQNSPTVHDDQKEILASLKIILLDQINKTRSNALKTLAKLEEKEAKPDFIPGKWHIQLKTESQNALDATLPMSNDTKLLMRRVQMDCEKVLKELYQPQLDNESMDDYLDSIESDMNSWGKILEFVIYSPQIIGGKKEKPKLPLDTINYAQIQRLYSSNAVDKIMNALANNFADQGGNDLYFKLANSFENSPQQFLEYSISISTNEAQNRFPENENRVPAQKLSQYYFCAGQDVNNLWNDTDWTQYGSSEKPELTTRVSKVIVARAYLQFVHKTAPYLYFPNNFPREIVNSVLDVPKGLFQTVRHPIDTFRGLGSLLTVRGWKNIGNSAINHPVRFFGSTAIAAAAGFGGPKSPTPTGPGKTVHLSSVSHKTAHAIKSSSISHKTAHAINPQLSLIPIPTNTEILSSSSSRVNSSGRNNSITIMESVGDLNSSPSITNEMLEQLRKQLATSINPKITYCIWYEKQVLGKKVAVLADEYIKNMGLIEASDSKANKSVSSTLSKSQTTGLGLFLESGINEKESTKSKPYHKASQLWGFYNKT